MKRTLAAIGLSAWLVLAGTAAAQDVPDASTGNQPPSSDRSDPGTAQGEPSTSNDSQPGAAEPPESQSKSKPEPANDSPRRSMQRRFDRSTPAVGSPLPDVTAFDADGNPFHLGSLKGHYSVIVFGCLT